MSQRLLSKDLRRQRRPDWHRLRHPLPRRKNRKFPQTAKRSREISTRITLTASGCTTRRAGASSKKRAPVEKRLHDVYANYQRLSERKTLVGGLPAVEYQYRGKADEHDWSGKLVVVARGKDMFTVLAMTYADSDLIQIQENVIARAIASLDFNAH